MNDVNKLHKAGIPYPLYTPTEIEKELGEKYFYRMRLYRWEIRGYLRPYFQGKKKFYYVPQVLEAANKSLLEKISKPLKTEGYSIVEFEYNSKDDKEINVAVAKTGKNSKWFSVDTMDMNEVSLARRILFGLDIMKTYLT